MKHVQDSLLSELKSQYVDVENEKIIGEYPTSVIKNSAIGIDYQSKSIIQKYGSYFLIWTQTNDYSLVRRIDEHHRSLPLGSSYGDEHFYQVCIDLGNDVSITAYGIYIQKSKDRGDICFITRQLQMTIPIESPMPYVCDVVVTQTLDFIGNRYSSSGEISEKKIDYRIDCNIYQCDCECFELTLTKYTKLTHLKLSRKDKKMISNTDVDAFIDSLSIVLFEPIRNHVAICRTYTDTHSTVDIFSDSTNESTAKHIRPSIKQIGIPEKYAPFLCTLIGSYREETCDTYYHVLKVISESSAIIQTRLLGLCTAIEAITNKLEVDVGGADADEIDRVVSEINTYIRSTYKDESQKNLINRLTSSLDRVRQTNSASNRLKKLQSLGTVSKNEFDTWNSLRNTLAHGREVFNIRKYDNYPEALQVLIDLTYKLISEYVGFK